LAKPSLSLSKDMGLKRKKGSDDQLLARGGGRFDGGDLSGEGRGVGT